MIEGKVRRPGNLKVTRLMCVGKAASRESGTERVLMTGVKSSTKNSGCVGGRRKAFHASCVRCTLMGCCASKSSRFWVVHPPKKTKTLKAKTDARTAG